MAISAIRGLTTFHWRQTRRDCHDLPRLRSCEHPNIRVVNNDFALVLLEQPVPTIPANIASPFRIPIDFFAGGE